MTPLRLTFTTALLLPMAAVAQQSVVPTLKIDTKLTVVNVTVTDKNGHPVHGLKARDFVIKEDGKPQPIRNFDEYGAARPAIPVGPKPPPGVYTNQPTAADRGAVNILLFTDLGRPDEMLFARSQAEKYLKSLPDGTRVAILVQENGLHLVQNITTDRDVLLAMVRTILYHPVPGATFVGVSSFDVACEVANQQSRLTIDALRQIAASFAAVPDRKNLIWFTHGIPWLTNISYFKEFPKFSCLDDDTEQLEAAYGMLSASQVAISAVDPRGIEPPSIDAAASAASVSNGFIDSRLNQESITGFADKTGGTAYHSRNDLDGAMGEAIAANADYYTISYTPPLKGYDGKYHNIDINVNRRGLQLSYRKGYTSLDLAKLNTTIEHNQSSGKSSAQQTDVPPAISLFRAEMLHGATPSTELLLAVRITPASTPPKPASPPVKGELNPKVKPNPLFRYDVVYMLPTTQIMLNQNSDGMRKGSVDFDVIAYGEDGTRLNLLNQTVDISLKPENVADFQSKPLYVPLQLDLPPGKLFLRVGALDTLSGKSGTLEVPQTVAKP